MKKKIESDDFVKVNDWYCPEDIWEVGEITKNGWATVYHMQTKGIINYKERVSNLTFSHKPSAFQGLNENEKRVLFAIRNAIKRYTDNKYCYFENIKNDMIIDSLTGGYMTKDTVNDCISSLRTKKRIYFCTDEHCIGLVFMRNSDGNKIDYIFEDRNDINYQNGVSDWRW